MNRAIILAVAFASTTAFAKGGGHGGSHSSGSSGHSSGSTSSAGGSHSVRGHFTKDGTYVQPHHATNPDGTKVNNWSSKPNVNPYTGKEGTKDPYKP